MKKIPNVFERDWLGDKSRVIDKVNPGCEWVLAGEGKATRKWDGTATLLRGGKMFRRYDAKNGKAPPPNFEPAQEPDAKTGHWPGWIPCERDDPAARWHFEAYDIRADVGPMALVDGTYELCGPKVSANPERAFGHVLIPHGQSVLVDVERTHAGLAAYLAAHVMEGIVFHHPDGRMAKIRAGDLGLKWPR